MLKKLRKIMEKIEIGDLYDDLDNVIEELEENAILDLDNFKRQLKQQNLITKELEDFIENYMRFDND